jgi:hypothetical protein
MHHTQDMSEMWVQWSPTQPFPRSYCYNIIPTERQLPLLHNDTVGVFFLWLVPCRRSSSTLAQKPMISPLRPPLPPSPTEPFQQHLGHDNDNAPTDSHSPIVLWYYCGRFSIFRLVLERRSSYAATCVVGEIPTVIGDIMVIQWVREGFYAAEITPRRRQSYELNNFAEGMSGFIIFSEVVYLTWYAHAQNEFWG